MEKETLNGLAIERGALEAIVNFQLMFEKGLTSLKIRKTHLENNGTPDPETIKLLAEAEDFKKEFILKPVKKLLADHPAFPWFSKVKGVGNENIAKVISLIDINKADTISALWKYAGYGVDENGKPDRLKKGEKLHFNKTLKTMCYRLGVSLLKAHGISKTGTKFGCDYENEYAFEVSEAKRLGFKIADINDIPKGKEKEYRNSLHVHNRAFRKMIKHFLSCLWLYWRKAEGLPIRDPYAIEKLGHTHLIVSEEMIDR
jgi:hypothetical protein